MRSFALFVVLAISFGMANNCVFSQENAEAEKPQSLSKQDIQQIREAAQGLKEVFGIEDDSAKKNDSKTGKPEKKTMADVADKAVDMAGRMVAQAAETIQKVAPDVWRIMIKQQYAKATSIIIIPVGLLIILFIAYRQVNKWWPRPERGFDSNDENCNWWIVCKIVPFIGGIALSVWFAIALSFSVKYLINPEFYAIRDMLMMILGKGNPG